MPNVTSHVITQWKIQSSAKTEFAEAIFMPGDSGASQRLYFFKILQTLEESEGCLDYGSLWFISFPTEK